MFFDKAAIAETTHTGKVSTEHLSIPFDWVFGTTLTLSALFFSVVWWVRGLSSKVDNNSKMLEGMLSKCVAEHAKMDNFHDRIQEDLRRQFRTDISQSASDICHGFELFALEMRSDLKRLHEKIDERNQAIADLDEKQEKQGKKLDLLGAEFSHVVSQLQAKNIDVHYRDRD